MAPFEFNVNRPHRSFPSHGGSGIYADLYGQGQSRTVPKPKSYDKAKPHGALLHTISTSMGQGHPGDAKPIINDCKYIASYNWLDKKNATVLVPGSPPSWLPPAQTPRLGQDSGTYYRDPNAARYPKFPLEPAARAIFALLPEFDSSTVDIVACGNTIGSLLRSWSGRQFRFGVERIGNTVFLVRQTAPKEVIEDVHGYGHTFPDAYTSWEASVKGSASHQRLVEYQFGNLRCVIRSESDGYLPAKAPAAEQSHSSVPDAGDIISMQESARSLMVSEAGVASTSKLTVKHAGRMVPQGAIFDLKTRSARKVMDMDEFLPRLWANQTPNFIIARHEFGKFEDIEIMDVLPLVRKWEQENEKLLSWLLSVLTKLIEITGRVGCSQVQVSCEKAGELKIWKETKSWSALPNDLIAKWVGQDDGGVRVDGQGPEEEIDSEDEGNDAYLNF